MEVSFKHILELTSLIAGLIIGTVLLVIFILMIAKMIRRRRWCPFYCPPSQVSNYEKDAFWVIQKFKIRRLSWNLACTSVLYQNWVNWKFFLKLPHFPPNMGLFRPKWPIFSKNSTFFSGSTEIIPDQMTATFLYFGKTRTYKWEKRIGKKIGRKKCGTMLFMGAPG